MPPRKPLALGALYDVRPVTRGVHTMPKAADSIATGLTARAALQAAIKATRDNTRGEDSYGKAESFAIVHAGASSWDFWTSIQASCKIAPAANHARWIKLSDERRWHARNKLPVRCSFMSDSFKAAAVKSGRRKPRRKKR